jgi:guanyl-specific ribonuclease Sa
LWIGALLLAGAAAWGLGERAERAGTGASPQVAAQDVVRPAREDGRSRRRPSGLPDEAVETLARIRAGGPFEYRQDGSVFENRERLLPAQPRGYYREYTVETPGSYDRGARRIVSGGHPPVEFFYTDDHYRSFRRLDARAGR